MVADLAAHARSIVRDLDPTNELTFLRVKSHKHEVSLEYLQIISKRDILFWDFYFQIFPINSLKTVNLKILEVLAEVLVAPDDSFVIIVLQNTRDEES